jgi:hypothetical protein
MDDYKEHLRRLAVHDDALIDTIAVEGSSFTKSVIDERTAALVRVGATVAVDAALVIPERHRVPRIGGAILVLLGLVAIWKQHLDLHSCSSVRGSAGLCIERADFIQIG